MISEKAHKLFLKSLLVLFILTQATFGVKAFRIELLGGTVYENATLTVDKQQKVINIQVGDWKSHVHFPDIARILDQNGNDVTAEYLGEKYQPSDKRYRKRAFNVGISFGTNYTFPLGDYYRGMTSGIGFALDISVPITESGAIRATISKAGMTDDLVSQMHGVILIDDKMKFDVWRYLLSVEHYNWPRWKLGGKNIFYAYTGLGAITHTLSGTLWLKDAVTGEFFMLIANDKPQTELFVTFGGGIVLMFSQMVGIEVGTSFDLVGIDVEAFVFDLKLGVLVVLQRG